MLRHRYLLSVEGNDVATNLKWTLASNSVVLMPVPTRESFILEGSLTPWVHYVPIKSDTSDLMEKVAYCERNLQHCENISLASTRYMLQFSTRRKLFKIGARVFENYVDIMRETGLFY